MFHPAPHPVTMAAQPSATRGHTTMDIFSEPPKPAPNRGLWIAVAIVAAVLLAAGLYTAYDFFFGSKRGRNLDTTDSAAAEQTLRSADSRGATELARLLDAIHRTARGDDPEAVLPRVSDLMVSSPEDWFPLFFGGEMGRKLAASYARDATAMRSYLRDTFRELEERDGRSVTATRITADNLTELLVATEAVPIAIGNSLPVYRVRMSDRPRVMQSRFGYFARDGMSYRYLGRLDVADFPADLRGDDLVKTHDVLPSFPRRAQRKGTQGFLQYIVIIGRDGRVDSVELEHGDPVLAGYGKKAILQWRYQPYRDRGESVRVRIHTAIGYRF